MSRYELVRWAGLAGIASGLLIIVGAAVLPFSDPVISGALFVSGHILLFFLLTGAYAAYYVRSGIIGLLGYALSTIGNSLFVTFQLMYSFVISGIEGTWVLGAVNQSSSLPPTAVPVAGAVFGIGLLLVAIATTRVRAPAAWAAWLMFTGIALNLVFSLVPADLPGLTFVVPPFILGLGAAGFGWRLRQN